MEPRFAFTAELWGDAAVVCRVIEGCAGTIVEQEFGIFATWTQAYSFARKLNEGLDIGSLDVQQIVTSAILASRAITRRGLHFDRALCFYRVHQTARSAQAQVVQEELALALTFCRSARLLSRGKSHHAIRFARKALLRASQFVTHFKGDSAELEPITSGAAELNATLQHLSCRSEMLAPPGRNQAMRSSVAE